MKTVFENGQVLVEVNDLGDVFVSNKSLQFSAKIRVTARRRDLLVAAVDDCSMTPTSFLGESTFWVRPK